MTFSDVGSKLGYEDYLCFPNDGQRHEIIDGDHFVNPAPTPLHQQVCGQLYVMLFSQIQSANRGRVYFAPIDLQLSECDIVQPDLIVVLNEHTGIIARNKIEGTPDLVVEVLSDSTAQLDRGLKKKLYERAGVPEYWVVDLVQRHVEQFVLRKERTFVQVGPHTDRFEAATIPGVLIDVTALWG